MIGGDIKTNIHVLLAYTQSARLGVNLLFIRHCINTNPVIMSFSSPIDHLHKRIRRRGEKSRDDTQMLQRMLTVGRIPINLRKNLIPACSNRAVFVSPSGATLGGISTGDVLIRQVACDSDMHGAGQTGMCSGSSESVVTSSVFELTFRCPAYLSKEEGEAVGKVINLALETVKPSICSPGTWISIFIDQLLKICCPIEFQGISETTLESSCPVKSDAGITATVDGSVSIIADDVIPCGAYVCVLFPNAGFNIEGCLDMYKDFTEESNRSEDKIRSIKSLFREHGQSSSDKMRVVSMEHGEVQDMRRLMIDVIQEKGYSSQMGMVGMPIGQCVRGSSGEGDLIQVRLFSHVHTHRPGVSISGKKDEA